MDEFNSIPGGPEEEPAAGQFNGSPQLGGLPPQAPQPPVYIEPQPLQQIYDARPPKQRRVGTFTLGLTLILLGILIPCALFMGAKAWNFLRFAPVILVFLGVETLIFAFRFKSDKLRYDGLSVFLVIAITVATLGGSAVVPPIANAAEYSKLEYKVRRAAEDEGIEAVNQLGFIGSVYSYDYRGGDRWFLLWGDESDWQAPELTVRLRLDSIGIQRPTKAQVAEAFYQLAQRMQASEGVHDLRMDLSAELPEGEIKGSAYYEVDLLPGDLPNLNAELVEKRMQVSIEREYSAEDYPDEVFPEGYEYSEGFTAGEILDDYEY